MAYFRDAVYSIANALGQIKNNCTGLTEASGFDYCNTPNITSNLLGQAIRQSTFYGDTGSISFSGNDRQGMVNLRDLFEFL